MSNAAALVEKDCCVVVADCTAKTLVKVELSLDGRFDDNMLEKMVVGGTVGNLL